MQCLGIRLSGDDFLKYKGGPWVGARGSKQCTHLGQGSWQQNRTENCGELTFHSPPPTPLLPAPTLSAGESRVSEGESWVKSTGGASQSTRSSLESQNGLPLFFGCLLETPRRVAMVEPPVSYLKFMVPDATCEIAISVESAGRALFCLPCHLFDRPLPSY
jgi:hypothetical protein